ncbi:MBL fold metallo-hydrolase [Crocinitomix catalasitica]|uniref:MBL fold metallo-hydrolase n=1 Tax=Crocinitomix catalasitica TaxID=184607 RepID=UPI0004898322|nr:MBL fold metallo-hydrolase [Crocinitomix catalasitica]
MKIEQIYTGCLAQGAYYIESNGEVAIIDPLREVDHYIELAASRGAKIKYILETHFHADFVSGHLTLSKKTGAPIIYGPAANPDFDAIVAEDNQEFKLGKIKIKVLHTPGHTMESSTYLVIDEEGKKHAIFSGDTLFLGDVGRPDLAQKAAHMTQEELAATLFKSLRTKIMTLPDETIIYPGHGAGSACGKNMSKETIGSIGEEKKTNYALRSDMTEEEFVKEVTDGLAPPPAYFPMNVMMNKMGYQDIDEVLKTGKQAMTANEFEEAANATEAVMLDVRTQGEFAVGHVPNSIFIGLNGDFAPWVGALIKDVKQPILLIVGEDQLEEAITRLSRVGFDHIIGYLKDSIDGWKTAGKEVGIVNSIPADTFSKEMNNGKLSIIDVRKPSEFASEHVIDALSNPLNTINDHLKEILSEGTNYVHCAGGYRSMIAISILKSRGIHNLIDVQGGFSAIKETTVPVTAYVCPSTL